MKTFTCKSKILRRWITFLLILISLTSGALITKSLVASPSPVPGPVTLIQSNTACSGNTFTIPVTVTGFNNVAIISLKMNYDTTLLQYQGAVLDPALSGLSPLYGVLNGQFSLSAWGSVGVNLTDNTALMTITFLAKPGVSGTALFSWSAVTDDCEYGPPAPDPPYTSVPFSSYFLNGNCVISLSPAPTITGPGTTCKGIAGNVYSTESGKSNYVWTVSAGATITAGGTATDNTVTVTWNTAGSGSVQVNYTETNGCTALLATQHPVTVVDPVPVITTLSTTIPGGITTGHVFTTDAGMTNYIWTVSSAGAIMAGTGTNSITVDWTNPTGNQTVSVSYTDPNGCVPATSTQLFILYYPFPGPINPSIIPQFVDPMPHFAAGLRVDAKTGGNLLIKAAPCQQIALSTGTVLATGTIGPSTPTVGRGNYAGYGISKDNGATWGPVMWPAQTIEAKRGNQLTVQYRNDLYGMTYADFNILTDQTLMPTGYTPTGNIFTDPYSGPIPMVVHLHGGEIPSNSDGGPTAWFTPGYGQLGPGFVNDASSICTYPNTQEGTTLWYHPHDQGLTRINVYTGLAGYYFLRGTNEDALHLPGWSGDDSVREITPAGRSATFNGSKAYLPEIELAIQDRMFNVNGELYWPVAPTNPGTHPYWTPEFFGNVMTVNGKSWPYLSVAPRKYMFRFLDGCNARFLNMWLSTDTATGTLNGPPIYLLSTEGGFLDAPVPTQYISIGPAERPMVMIDFTGVPAGTVFYLMNDAAAPYPFGDPVIHGLTDRIMAFVVNGEMVSNLPPAAGTDKSVIPTNLRPLDPMIKLTDFSGNPNITPAVKRQILLNEILSVDGPLIVSVNNSRFESYADNGVIPAQFGDPTEIPVEGTTELWQIINTTGDAHPIHPHLVQWQVVSRQAFDDVGYMAAYAAAWVGKGIPNYPSYFPYPGGSGSPFPYNTLNSDGAVGGNPSVSPFLIGTPVPPSPAERGWKDSFKSLPGEVLTVMVRLAPTDKPLTATQDQLIFPFDPSLGPGYVWHCHIIDHEDMDMMRPNPISPSPVRFPQISAQPVAFIACEGDAVSFSVTASSITAMTYIWQLSTDAGVTWTNLTEALPYSNVATATLSIAETAPIMNNYRYRCIINNVDGQTISASALLTVQTCAINGTIVYHNAGLTPLSGLTITVNSTPPVSSGLSQANGSFSVPSVKSGVYTLTVSPNGKPVGGVNSTDAGLVNYWGVNGGTFEQVHFLAGDVLGDNWINAADAQKIQHNFVFGTAFPRGPWVFWPTNSFVNSNTDPNPMPTSFTITVDHAGVANFNLYGLCTGDFTCNYVPGALKDANANVSMDYLSRIPAGPDQMMELELRSGKEMSVGAVSLVLNLPSDLIEVTDVKINNSAIPASFLVEGNELRIGWNSSDPVNLTQGQALITLTVRTLPTFTAGKTIKIELVNDPRNEIADQNMSIIPNAPLGLDILESDMSGISENTANVLQLSIYPNPFRNYSTIHYVLPDYGKVEIFIYDLLGTEIGTLINETQQGGHHELRLDANDLQSGVYSLKLHYKNAGNDFVTFGKFMVNK